MKLRSIVAAAAFAALAPVHAADKHAHTPRHGGVVAEARDMDLELVAAKDSIRLYASGHAGAVDLSKASARVTLLTGKEKQEVDLGPAGDRLEATGSFKVGSGTRAVAVVTVNGKPSTARFTLK